MSRQTISLIVLSHLLLVSALWAGTDKACQKRAKADYQTEMRGCKNSKGAEKKACVKKAKANYTQSKKACR